MAFFKRSKMKARDGGAQGEQRPPSAEEDALSGSGVALPSAVPSSGRNPETAIPGMPNWHARTVVAQGVGGEAFLAQKVWVSIADILPRIPAHVVERGAVNPAQRLWFKLGDLAALAAASNFHVRVGLLADICPELFGAELDFERDTEVVFPWGRVFEQVAALVPPRERSAKSRSTGALPDRPAPAPAPVQESAAPAAEENGEIPRIEALNRHLVDLEKRVVEAERARDRLAAELADFRKRADARAGELVAERDRLIHESSKISGALARALEAHRKFVETTEWETGRLAAAVASSAPRDEKVKQLTDQLVAIAAERDRIQQEKNEAEAEAARMADELRFALRRVTDERDALLGKSEAVSRGLAAGERSAEQEVAAMARERDAAMKLKDIALQDLNRLRETSRRQIEALQADLARTKKRGTDEECSLRAERDDLAHGKAELSAQLAKLVEDHRAQAAHFAAARAAINRSREEMAREAAELRRAHETEVAALRAERTNIEATSSELSARLLQIKETARRQIEALETQFERSAEEHKAQVEALISERERLLLECAALRDQVSTRSAEAERLRQDLERISEHFERFRQDAARQVSALSDKARKNSPRG